MADDQIIGAFNDGELWLPLDFFSPSSKFTTTPQTQFIPKPYYNPTRLPDLHFQLFGPMVSKGSNDFVSADYFSSHCNPAIGGDVWTGLRPLPSFNPVQSQVGRERDLGMQGKRWFLESWVVENRVVQVVGVNGKRGYGGTGVYLPDYTTVETTTTLSASSRKRNNVRVTKQENKACLKRCSPGKAHVLKEDECNFELPPEIMALPQEWTY